MTRQLTVDLSPPVLEDDGLTVALQWLQTQMAALHDLHVELKAAHPFHIPDEDMRVLLFQIVRELLFNIVKHAETDRATVMLREGEADGHLIIEVADEGSGFNMEEAEHARDGGFGLFSVRERLGLFGGRMEIASAPGAGTRVTVHSPIAEYSMNLEPVRVRPTENRPPQAQRRPPMSLRIFIVEDHPVMREMLGALLRKETDFEVSGAAVTAEEALEQLAETAADLPGRRVLAEDERDRAGAGAPA